MRTSPVTSLWKGPGEKVGFRKGVQKSCKGQGRASTVEEKCWCLQPGHLPPSGLLQRGHSPEPGKGRTHGTWDTCDSV